MFSGAAADATKTPNIITEINIRATNLRFISYLLFAPQSCIGTQTEPGNRSSENRPRNSSGEPIAIHLHTSRVLPVYAGDSQSRIGHDEKRWDFAGPCYQ